MATKKQSSAGAQAQAENPVTGPKPETSPAAVKARVLATGPFGTINDVVELAPHLLAQGVAAGQVDPHPDAVAHAESLK